MYYVVLTEGLTGLCNTNDKELTYTWKPCEQKVARDEAIGRRNLGRKIAASVLCVDGIMKIILSNLLPDVCLEVCRDITRTGMIPVPILQAVGQWVRLSHEGVRRTEEDFSGSASAHDFNDIEVTSTRDNPFAMARAFFPHSQQVRSIWKPSTCQP